MNKKNETKKQKIVRVEQEYDAEFEHHNLTFVYYLIYVLCLTNWLYLSRLTLIQQCPDILGRHCQFSHKDSLVGPQKDSCSPSIHYKIFTIYSNFQILHSEKRTHLSELSLQLSFCVLLDSRLRLKGQNVLLKGIFQ